MDRIRRRIYQIHLVIKLFFFKIASRFNKKEEFWLISERGKEARDNGYALYRWIKKNHPEQKVKFIISSNSKDLNRIEPEDRIEFNSAKHYLAIWNAKCLISTHIMGYTPDLVFFSMLDKKYNILRGKKKIFLQHGIIKDKLEGLFHGNINVNLFISGSDIEFHYLSDNFGFPTGIIRYTGLCRFDNLMNYKSKKQILIMPTFRMYADRNNFEESEYFKAYRDLLSINSFHEILEMYDYSVIFYPHYEFQSKIDSFKAINISSRITIADMNYDVQTLLKESEILVTDFSSVFFDMMYMNKPVIFYQFDEEQYRKGHYKQGYLNYNDVGPVVKTADSLITIIKTVVSNKDCIAPYQDYYNKTFPIRDSNNCLRVFNAIKHVLHE